MSRKIKFITKELGDVHLLAIWERGGQWEPEWEPLRGTRMGDQFTQIRQAVLDQALIKHLRPLVEALGIPPAGALRKLPLEQRACYQRNTCALFGKECHPFSPKMPWCFEPEGVADEKVRKATALAIECWREGVYLVVVLEDRA